MPTGGGRHRGDTWGTPCSSSPAPRHLPEPELGGARLGRCRRQEGSRAGCGSRAAQGVFKHTDLHPGTSPETTAAVRVGDVSCNDFATNPGESSPAPAGPNQHQLLQGRDCGAHQAPHEQAMERGGWGVHGIVKDPCLQFKAVTCATAWDRRAEREKCHRQLRLSGKVGGGSWRPARCFTRAGLPGNRAGN